jgi:hypothetical protein
MLKRHKNNTLSTSPVSNGNTASAQMPSGSHTQWSYHNLPLSVFIDQIESGKVSTEIYEQFFEAIKDKQQKYIAKLVQKINILESKYTLIMCAITYFECCKRMGISEFDADIMEIIKQHINIKDNDTVDVILSRAQKFITDLELLRHELEKISPKGGEGIKADRSYFTHLIIAVSKHMKSFIDKRVVTVAEFAEMINDLRSENEEVSKQIKSRNHASTR